MVDLEDNVDDLRWVPAAPRPPSTVECNPRCSPRPTSDPDARTTSKVPRIVFKVTKTSSEKPKTTGKAPKTNPKTNRVEQIGRAEGQRTRANLKEKNVKVLYKPLAKSDAKTIERYTPLDTRQHPLEERAIRKSLAEHQERVSSQAGAAVNNGKGRKTSP